MRHKKSVLTQLQMNQLATKRLIVEMKEWDEDLLTDVFEPLNKKFGVNIYNVKELEELANKAEVEQYAQSLDDILDEIASNDGFGTEQQCDPRGDFRNQKWSMWNVES